MSEGTKRGTPTHISGAPISDLFRSIENEWRTVPSDLAGWAMRAQAMLILSKRYHVALERIEDCCVNEPNAAIAATKASHIAIEALRPGTL